jgi:uncharacterized protein
MRLLLWVVIIFALVILVLHIKKTIIQRHNRTQVNPRSTDNSEAMVQCAQCGIHIPASEAILIQSDMAFCSEEHRLKHFSK